MGDNQGRSDWLPSYLEQTGFEVTVSAPGKVILHGEHSVVYGKLAIAASLGLRTKLRIVELYNPNLLIVDLPLLDFSYVYDLQKLKEQLLDHPFPLVCAQSDFNWEHPELVHHDHLVDITNAFVSSTTGTICLNSSQQMSLNAMFYLLAGILGSVNVDLPSFGVTSTSELNIGAGTGSSASFLVCFAGALVHFVKLKGWALRNFCKEGYKPCWWEDEGFGFNRRELDMICKWAYYAERIIHGTPSGVDNTVCTYGSMVEFRKGLAPKLTEVPTPFKILLINTNVARETKQLTSRVARLHEVYPDLVKNILNAMEDVAFIALQHIYSVFASNDEDVKAHYEELERLSSMNHNLLSALGVSHVKLDEAVLALAEYGLHGKLTGAGGGGYAICLIPPYVKSSVVDSAIQSLRSRGFEAVVTSLGGLGVEVEC